LDHTGIVAKVPNLVQMILMSNLLIFLGAQNLPLGVSGVARVPRALGQGIILRPLSTKTTEFEVKNWCKSTEEAKTEHLL